MFGIPKFLNSKSILRNVSNSAFGSTFFSVSQWLLIVLIAKLETENSPGSLTGMYVMALAITTPVFMFCNTNLRLYITTDAKNEFSPQAYLFTRILTSLAAVLIVGMLVYLVSTISSNWNSKLIAITALMALAKFFDSLSDLIYGLYQQNRQLHLLRNSFLLRGLYTAAAGLIALIYKLDLQHLVLLLCLGAISVFAFYDYRNFVEKVNMFKEQPKRTIDSPPILVATTIITGTYALGFLGGIVALNVALPRFIIEYYHGIALAGIFGSIFYLTRVGHLILQASIIVFLPILSKYRNSDNKELYLKVHYFLMLVIITIGVAVVTLVSIFGHDILELFFSARYAEYSTTFTVLSCAFVFTALSFYLQNCLTVIRSFKIQIAGGLIVMLSLLLIAPFVVTRFDIYAVALVILAARAFQFIYLFIWTNKSIENSFTSKQLAT